MLGYRMTIVSVLPDAMCFALHLLSVACVCKGYIHQRFCGKSTWRSTNTSRLWPACAWLFSASATAPMSYPNPICPAHRQGFHTVTQTRSTDDAQLCLGLAAVLPPFSFTRGNSAASMKADRKEGSFRARERVFC